MPGTALLTLLTLVAFAANSVLCRMALKDGQIDPVSFTQIRLLAGAIVLLPFLLRQRASVWPLRRSQCWPALALSVYAIAFSLAYVALDAGIGALIMFAMVQFTMIGWSVMRGIRPAKLEWLGLGIAFAGLLYLTAPGLSAPPLQGALLMAAAGIAWGAYSVLGQREGDPVSGTARNFILSLPLAALLFAAEPAWGEASSTGIALAVASGALASGLGYVIWYAALKGLSAIEASTVQLAVPVVAALGGIIFLGEAITVQAAIASALILGGIFVTIVGRRSNGAR